MMPVAIMLALSVSLTASYAGKPRTDQDDGTATARDATLNGARKSARSTAQKPDRPAKSDKAAAKVAGFTLGREAAAMTFVGQHHPELAELLVQLKESDVREYRRAIHDLFRTSERLAQIQEQEPARYEQELDAWKLKSRVQLLAARLRMTPGDEALRLQLKQTLLEQIDHQRARLDSERLRMAERLERLDAHLEKLQSNREQMAERQLQQLTSGRKRSGQGKPSRGPSESDL